MKLSFHFSFLNLSWPIFIALCAIWPQFADAQSQTTNYSYDALGRLILVEDSQNGDREFKYDPAGNRTQVIVANQTGAGVPAKPAGLSATLVHERFRIYQMEWNSVGGATHYILTLDSSPPREVTLTATTASTMSHVQTGSRGDYVRACDTSGCSEPSYF